MVRKSYILIADSDPSDLTSLGRELSSAGYTIYTARNGMEVMNICRMFKVDLAIIDITMPDLSGIEFAKYVQYGFGVPIIVLSAEDDPKSVTQYMNIGVYAYTAKPIDTRTMLPMIATALGDDSSGS